MDKKNKILTQSSFKNISTEELKKNVTTKVEKIINVQIKATPHKEHLSLQFSYSPCTVLH